MNHDEDILKVMKKAMDHLYNSAAKPRVYEVVLPDYMVDTLEKFEECAKIAEDLKIKIANKRPIK